MLTRTHANQANRHALLSGVIVTAVLFGLGGFATTRAQETKSAKPAASLVERGKYLVENVAVCSQCHTPRDSAGTPDYNHWLQGGPLWLQPANHVSNWPLQAPRLAGSVPGTDAEMVTLLTTGIWRDGTRLRAPMPQFRMNREDAEAVVAYLRSLNPGSPLP